MESTNEFFENAPIIVAMLQFRYEKIENFDIELIKKISENLKHDFPIVNPQIVQGIRIDNNDNETSVSLDEKKVEGIQIMSKNSKEYFTITNQKFTFQSHEKYEGWDDFIHKIINLWNLFSKEFSLKKLKGVSLRYVNKFNLPSDTKNLQKYFNVYLKDDKNSHSIYGFQLKFSSFDKENNFKIHIGHALEKPIKDSIPYLIDIDVLYDDIIENNEEVVWPIFEKLRQKKNHIFSSGLTNEAKTLIN